MLHTQHRAQWRAWTHHPEIQIWAEIKSQTLNQLSDPGTPYSILKQTLDFMLFHPQNLCFTLNYIFALLYKIWFEKFTVCLLFIHLSTAFVLGSVCWTYLPLYTTSYSFFPFFNEQLNLFYNPQFGKHSKPSTSKKDFLPTVIHKGFLLKEFWLLPTLLSVVKTVNISVLSGGHHWVSITGIFPSEKHFCRFHVLVAVYSHRHSTYPIIQSGQVWQGSMKRYILTFSHLS